MESKTTIPTPPQNDGNCDSSTVVELTPPPLPFTLHHHKKKLIALAVLLLMEFGILPVTIFYALWYGTKLNHGALFAIVTSVFGFVTGADFALRFLRLLQKNDTFRPIGSKRGWLDFYQISTGLGFTMMTVILIVASIPHEPWIRMLACPVAAFSLQIGLELILSVVLYHFRIRTPVRLSSTPVGMICPPLLFVLVEDLIGVDGNGGQEYRQALRSRFDASPIFRRLLVALTWFWGVGFVTLGVAMMALVFTIPKVIAYGIGWGVPCIWAVIWVWITTRWTQRQLIKEKRWFRSRSSRATEKASVASSAV